MTQKEFALLTDVSLSNLRNWEQERCEPSADTKYRIEGCQLDFISWRQRKFSTLQNFINRLKKADARPPTDKDGKLSAAMIDELGHLKRIGGKPRMIGIINRKTRELESHSF